jgi:hypothetical protein
MGFDLDERIFELIGMQALTQTVRSVFAWGKT